MIISFFKDGKYVAGANYSDYKDFLFCKDMEFNPENQYLEFNPETQDVSISEIQIQEPILTNQEIGDKILATVFEGNPYAQLADLTKSQVTTLALLIPILGKETIKTAYGPLIETLRKVSDARVAENLEPFDLSFLD